MAKLDERYLNGYGLPQSITNPALTSALFAAVAQDNAETRGRLYAALLKATLIVPAYEDAIAPAAKETSRIKVQGTELHIKTYEDPSGATLMAAFTDEDAVLAWMPDGTPYIALQGSDLFALADYNDIVEVVLNPGGPISGIIGRSEIASLAEGELPVRPRSNPAPFEVEILISSPMQLPAQPLLDTLRDAMARQPDILAAYLFQIHVQPQQPRLVVGVALSTALHSEQQDAVMESLLAEFDSVSTQETDGMEFLILDSADFLEVVRDTVPPLYER